MMATGMSRRLGSLDVRGTYPAELSAALSGKALISDLSLGSWRSQQVARDLCAQLGLSDFVSRRLSYESPPPPLEVPTHSGTGRQIDRETQGDAVTMQALDLAAAVHAQLRQRPPTVLYVLLGDGGSSWEPADATLLAFLAQGLRDTSHELRFVACGRERPTPPPGFVVSWPERPPESVEPGATTAHPWAIVPGIITPDLHELFPDGAAGLPVLENGCRLVLPELRGSGSVFSTDELQRLAHAARRVPWLAAYAAYHGALSERSFSALWQQARREFERGGYGLAQRYLSRALELAPTANDRGVCRLLMQAVLLKTQQFAAAAEQDDPHETLPDELRAWLWHAKGWALTFCGEHDAADSRLERARALLSSGPDREGYFYVTNILALNALQGGKVSRALSLESEIQDALRRADVTPRAAARLLCAAQDAPEPTAPTLQTSGLWQLRYINHLNLARLAKALSNFEDSAHQYSAAFATSDGVRSDSDMIYLHVNLARLEEARGRAEAALVEWLRAAVLWVSSPAPEALATRAVAAMGGRVTMSRHALGDELAMRLTDKLLESARKLGLARHIERAESAREPISWVRAEHVGCDFLSSNLFEVIGIPHMAVFATQAETFPAVSSMSLQRLGEALLSLLEPALWHGFRTVVVHDQSGRDLPQSCAEIVGSCLQLDLRTVRWAGRQHAFDDALLAQIEADLTVLPGPALSSCALSARGVVVSFKRYHEPIELVGAPGQAVAAVAASGGMRFADLAIALNLDAGGLRSLLRELERRRLILRRVGACGAAIVGNDMAFERDPLRPFGDAR